MASEYSRFNLRKTLITVRNLVEETSLTLHIYGKFSDYLTRQLLLPTDKSVLYVNAIENLPPTSSNCTFFLEKHFNLVKPIHNVFSDFKPKFSNSIIQIISADWLGSSSEVIGNMSIGISLAVEVLTFKAIIFISEQNDVENLTALNSNLIGWDKINMNSKIIVAGRNGLPKMLCGACNVALKNGDQPILVDLTEGMATKDIEGLWFELHRDLRRSKMLVALGRTHNCGPRDTFSGDRSALYNWIGCFGTYLSTKHNLTGLLQRIPPGTRNIGTMGTLRREYGMRPDSSKTMNAYHISHPSMDIKVNKHGIRIEKEMLIPYMANEISYTYRVFAKIETGFSIKNLLQSMDTFTWIFLLIASITIVFALSLVNTDFNYKAANGKCNIFASFLKSTFWTFAVTVDQSDDAIVEKFHTSYRSSLLLCIWLLTLIVVRNGYSGSIYASMSVHLPPKVPSLLETLLADENHFIGTVSFFPENKIFFCKMKAFLNAVYLSGENHLDEELLRSVKLLYRRTTYLKVVIGESFGIIIRNISRNYAIRTDKGHILLPKVFTLIDDHDTLPQLINFMRREASHFIIDTGEISKWSVQEPFYLTKNFLYDIFKPVFSGLSESGIYGYWRKTKDLMNLVDSVKRYDKQFNITTTDNIFSAVVMVDPRIQPVPPPKPAPLESFRMIFSLFSVIFLLICGVFLMEVVKDQLKSYFLNHKKVGVIKTARESSDKKYKPKNANSCELLRKTM
ncbi:unnamed protein product [Orchesella dallaii]|uniref:Uncharacterized protein n=1 Tax=Orchesella dallaii TaxID=48710 RepID=A0ABP1QHE9_9HEXA